MATLFMLFVLVKKRDFTIKLELTFYNIYIGRK